MFSTTKTNTVPVIGIIFRRDHFWQWTFSVFRQLFNEVLLGKKECHYCGNQQQKYESLVMHGASLAWVWLDYPMDSNW